MFCCSIKVLPDERGFVCAGDDSVVSAVATLEVSSEEDIRRAATALSGHSGPVTDCDTAACGHAILSSRYLRDTAVAVGELRGDIVYN